MSPLSSLGMVAIWIAASIRLIAVSGRRRAAAAAYGILVPLIPIYHAILSVLLASECSRGNCE